MRIDYLRFRRRAHHVHFNEDEMNTDFGFPLVSSRFHGFASYEVLADLDTGVTYSEWVGTIPRLLPLSIDLNRSFLLVTRHGLLRRFEGN
jgi:hypothetical protein